MDLSVEASEVIAFAERVARGPELLQRETTNAMRRVTDTVSRTGQEMAPEWRGTLKGSFGTIVTPMQGQVVVRAPHARTVEYGRRPGARMPPQGALVEWMVDHGFNPGDEFVLRRSISRRGIAPRPFLRPALERSTPAIYTEFRRSLAMVLRGIGGG